MIELRDIPFSLDTDRLLHEQRIQPGTANAALFSELVARVQEAGRPKAIYDVAFIEEKAEDSVVVDGVRFTSRALRRNLDPVERVFPFIATCGAEADAVRVPDDDLVQAFWLWTLKGVVLEAAIEHLAEHIRSRYRLTHTAVMEPGSGDATVWPLEQQVGLFSLFGDVEASIGVRLTESLLMIPTMSVSGFHFPTEAEFASCQLCHREACPSRKAPFSDEVWREMYQG